MDKTYEALNGSIRVHDEGVDINIKSRKETLKHSEIKRIYYEKGTIKKDGVLDILLQSGGGMRLKFTESDNDNFMSAKKHIEQYSLGVSKYFNALAITKLIIGIISIVLTFPIMFQSCAAGVVNALEASGEKSGTAGFAVAIIMLIAGIVGLVTRKNKGGSITAGVFYTIAGLIGITNYGIFGDLMIWSIICFTFAIVFIIGSIFIRNPNRKSNLDN